MGSGKTQGESRAVFQLDLDWQRQREKLLDWGREPQALGLVDVAVTMLFFLFNWAAAIWLKHNDYSVGAAVIAVVVLFSFRSRAFESAYQAYLAARARSSQLVATG